MRLKRALFVAVSLCFSLFFVWFTSLKRVHAQSPTPSLQDPLLYVLDSGILDTIDLSSNQFLPSVSLSGSCYFSPSDVGTTPDGVAAYVSVDGQYCNNYFGIVQAICIAPR